MQRLRGNRRKKLKLQAVIGGDFPFVKLNNQRTLLVSTSRALT